MLVKSGKKGGKSMRCDICELICEITVKNYGLYGIYCAQEDKVVPRYVSLNLKERGIISKRSCTKDKLYIEVCALKL